MELEDFPTKAEVCGSAARKRSSIKKEFYKKKRLSSTHGYPRGGVVMVDKDGNTTEENPAYLKRYYRSRLSKSIKKWCHRKFRRTKVKEALTKSAHKKMTEYWWILS